MAIWNYASDQRAAGQLAALGLRLSDLHRALDVGEAERRTYTRHDAASVPEAARWSKHVRSLSETLTPRGWKRIDPMNQPTLVHPDGKLWLITTSGDGSTGSAFAVPSNKNPKGLSIQQAVDRNGAALLTIGEADADWRGFENTWVFLTHPAGSKIQFEVSLPLEMQGDYITSWAHRILFPGYEPRDGASGDLSRRDAPKPSAPATPDYTVDVKRKSASQ